MNTNEELERLRRIARIVNRLAWGVVAGIMAYGIPIVYGYLTRHDVPKSTAWILSLAVDGALAVGLVATPILAQYGIKGGWVGALRWIAGLATWALNTAESWMGGVPEEGKKLPADAGPDWGGVFSHSWGPLMMFFAVEAAAYFSRKIADVIRKQEAAARNEAEETARLRAEAEEANRKRAEAEEAFRAEQRKRAEAEEAFRAEEANRKRAEDEAEEQRKTYEADRKSQAEERAEENRKSREQITLLKSQHAEAAARFRQQLEEVQASARDARAQAAEASDQASKTAGQLEESRLLAERAMADKLTAEQQVAAMAEAHRAVSDELARVNQAHDRLARRLEEQNRKSDPSSGVVDRKSNRKSVPASAPGNRKSLAVVPDPLPLPSPEDVPVVPGVNPELVARVLAAMDAEPGAKQARLAELAGTSDRTVRSVQTALKTLPAGASTEDDRAAV